MSITVSYEGRIRGVGDLIPMKRTFATEQGMRVWKDNYSPQGEYCHNGEDGGYAVHNVQVLQSTPADPNATLDKMEAATEYTDDQGTNCIATSSNAFSVWAETRYYHY